ncbi:hypothetical protein [Erythrobacter sp. THAF29]|uniref:hypothetical protein n=1 Tax=Erythrobacter sp. THAF29 TaxID=2587851 RepID=UPI001268988E|nr:hypothetical protein [Erythrobacter sp. THAF29]QFT76446.1 hypothetical protein FIU90_02705 [Erythrobacter sp. THAF29]
MRFHAALLLLAAPALMGAGPPDADLVAERAAIEQFQALDQRLQDIGWKLVRGNAGFCSDTVAATGLQLQDMASYGRPDIARAALGLERDFAVQTAANGSPAGENEAVRPNREVTFIGATDPNAIEAGEKLDWRRLKRVHDALEQELDRAGRMRIEFAGGEYVHLTPVFACATRFELAGKGGRAVADGSRVVIGAEFEGFAMSEDMLAAAIAHELAHNVLKHREWLDRNGRKRSHVRATEREADRLMPWLLANAGYDPEVAVTFFEKFKPSSGSVLFIKGSHAKWQDRAEAARAELATIRAQLESSDKADWSTNFTREIDAEQGL